MVQPYGAQALRLSEEPRTVAEPVGTFLDRGLFTAAGAKTLLYATAADALDMQLRWFDGSGTAGAAVGVPGAYSVVSLSVHAMRAVVAASEFDRSARRTLWVMDFARGTRTRLTFGPGRHRTPIWSSDGKTVVYTTELSEGATIMRKRADGDEEPRFK